mmetsp:Transcript_17074/g.49300  ORF Transcript_17074/g.49300 Transcript_17074/m.49300 type:complete len:137 (+) Transcript_17074:729-1139(+)
MRRWSAWAVRDAGGKGDSEHGASAVVEGGDGDGAGSGGDPVAVASVTRDLHLACGPQGLGRGCQRLIDRGRLEYMREVLFPGNNKGTDRAAAARGGRADDGCAAPPKPPAPQCELCHYVDPDMTPMNALLVGRWTR